jgi:ribosomal protein S18 acetylase RimI-like enzyme
MSIDILLLRADNAHLLQRVAADVFDEQIDERWTRRFLQDVSHHMMLAIDDDVVVGMASAVDYVHPDKAPQLWINEVGVASSHRRRGIGRMLIDALLAHGRTLGCTEAWLGTEHDNVPARALYESAGSKPEPFVLYSFPLNCEAVDSRGVGSGEPSEGAHVSPVDHQ